MQRRCSPKRVRDVRQHNSSCLQPSSNLDGSTPSLRKKHSSHHARRDVEKAQRGCWVEVFANLLINSPTSVGVMLIRGCLEDIGHPRSAPGPVQSVIVSLALQSMTTFPTHVNPLVIPNSSGLAFPNPYGRQLITDLWFWMRLLGLQSQIVSQHC